MRITDQWTQSPPRERPTIGFAPENWLWIGFASCPPFDSPQQIGFDLSFSFFRLRSLSLADLAGFYEDCPCFHDRFGFLLESQTTHLPDSTREFGFVWR
jgi:hypothetical protein